MPDETNPGLLALAQRIAEHMTVYNRVELVLHRLVMLADGNGRGIYLSARVEYKPGARVEVFGRYPNPQYGPYRHGLSLVVGEWEKRPGIGFTSSRDPAHIARDIERRFVGEYEAFYEKVKTAVDRHDAEMRRVEQFQELLAQVGDGEWSHRHYMVESRSVGEDYWEAMVYHDGQVKLTLERLDVETACEILELLRGRGKEGEGGN